MTGQTHDPPTVAPARFWQPEARGGAGHPRSGSAAIRLLVLALGVFAGQAVLFGPSLIGARVLLPLDVLRGPHIYMPGSSETPNIVINDPARTDLIVYYEPIRQFAISELRAGRLPWWSPYELGGVPCFRWNLSPPWLLAYFITSPVVLAWVQVLVALVAAGGAYLFFRRVLQVGYWPAAIAAWCYPLTGAYVFWQGFWLPTVMCWLPWMLAAVEAVVRRPSGWGGPMLALLSAIVLLSGAPDVGGQVLLASGIYAAGRLVQLVVAQRREKRRGTWRLQYAAGGSAAAWTIGILTSAWMLLPLAEYMQCGSRSMARGQGFEERPPAGAQELPQVVLPDMYGWSGQKSLRIVNGCIQESSAGAYAGFLATLVLAPLAFACRRHRAACVLALVLGFAGLSWALNVPIAVQIMRLPGLNFLSHNRFVFVTSFAVLMLAAIGLNTLWEARLVRRQWFLLPMAIVSLLLAWCLYRTAVLPERITTELVHSVQRGKPIGGISDMAGVFAVQDTYRRTYVGSSVLAALGVAAWLWLWFRPAVPRWGFPLIGMVLVGDLLWFGYGRAAQDDPALYYPRVPVLEQLAAAEPGRVIGLNCFPANLASTHGLCDVRGYDGVDPAWWVELLKPVADPKSIVVTYAATEWMSPKGLLSPAGLTLPPILSMLNVRYVVARGMAKPGFRPLLQGGDYIIWENPAALPRAFVPRRVETIADAKERMRRLSADDFDPRATALMEQPLDLPGECGGSASITEDTPQRVTIAAEMKTAGLIVLSDRWDPGWQAYLGGKQVPILRTNHAVRGVVVPAGRQDLQFRYEPATLFWGSVASSAAVLLWLAWIVAAAIIQRRRASDGIDAGPLHKEEIAMVPRQAVLAASSNVGQARGKKRRR